MNQSADGDPTSARRSPSSPVGASRIKVLWVIKGLSPGGAERLLLETAAALDLAAFDVSCAYLSPSSNQLAPMLEATGVPTLCIATKPRMGWIVRLIRLIRNGGFDIVHSHSPVPATGARAAVRLARNRPVHLTTEHGPWQQRHPVTRAASLMTSWLDDVCIAVGDEVAQSIRGPIRKRTITSIQGIDLTNLDRLRDNTSKPAANSLRLISVANFTSQKDHATLLQACRLLKHKHEVDFHLHLVGGGSDENMRRVDRLVADLGLEAEVSIHGFLADARPLLATCDVLLISSKWEAGPVAAMEAAALGVPIVATEVGLLREVFQPGHDCLLAPVGAPEPLAAAVASLAGDIRRRDALASSAIETSRLFDSRRSTAELEHIYRSALS